MSITDAITRQLHEQERHQRFAGYARFYPAATVIAAAAPFVSVSADGGPSMVQTLEGAGSASGGFMMILIVPFVVLTVIAMFRPRVSRLPIAIGVLAAVQAFVAPSTFGQGALSDAMTVYIVAMWLTALLGATHASHIALTET